MPPEQLPDITAEPGVLLAPETWAAYCDTETRFFDTENQAWGWAEEQLHIFREERYDGWDEEGAGAIVVMRVVARARKVDENAPYQCVEYRIVRIPGDEKGAEHVE